MQRKVQVSGLQMDNWLDLKLDPMLDLLSALMSDPQLDQKWDRLVWRENRHTRYLKEDTKQVNSMDPSSVQPLGHLSDLLLDPR